MSAIPAALKELCDLRDRITTVVTLIEALGAAPIAPAIPASEPGDILVHSLEPAPVTKRLPPPRRGKPAKRTRRPTNAVRTKRPSKADVAPAPGRSKLDDVQLAKAKKAWTDGATNEELTELTGVAVTWTYLAAKHGWGTRGGKKSRARSSAKPAPTTVTVEVLETKATDRKPSSCYSCNVVRRKSPCEHCGAR